MVGPFFDARKVAEVKYKQIQVQVRADGDGLEEGQFEAYASTFVDEPDSYGDVVAKGAFAKTLAEWATSKAKLPVLWGHDFADPFSNIGFVSKAVEDDYGLRIVGDLDLENPTAAQVYRLLKTGRVSKMSFAFDEVDGGFVTRNGERLYELREMKLHEVSVVPLPANPTADVLAVKQSAGFTAAEVAALKEMVAPNLALNVGEASSKSGFAEDANEESEGANTGEAVARINEEIKALDRAERGSK